MIQAPKDLPDVRDLVDAELGDVAGGVTSTAALTAASVAILRYFDDINLQLLGCVADGGTTRCVYSYEP
jgi:hypothetical protein